MSIELARRLFTVDDYYRMAAAGILHEDDRVELIEGEIIEMPPIGSFHAGVVNFISSRLSRSIPADKALILVQNPVRLGDLTEPQPDISIVRPRPDYYRRGHPQVGDVFLLIEVADTSATYDREIKLPLYARAGVAEVWIIDLGAETVEVYRDLSAGQYSAMSTARRGETVSPFAFADVELAVDDILG